MGGNPRPLAIVLDALDGNGTPETRRLLLSVVGKMFGLAPWLNLKISRPEKDIKRGFKASHHSLRPLDPDEIDSFPNIRAFTTQHMEAIQNRSGSLTLTWPGEEMKMFARCAGPFFAWAQTACTFLKMHPVRRLELELSGILNLMAMHMLPWTNCQRLLWRTAFHTGSALTTSSLGCRWNHRCRCDPRSTPRRSTRDYLERRCLAHCDQQCDRVLGSQIKT